MFKFFTVLNTLLIVGVIVCCAFLYTGVIEIPDKEEADAEAYEKLMEDFDELKESVDELKENQEQEAEFDSLNDTLSVNESGVLSGYADLRGYMVTESVESDAGDQLEKAYFAYSETTDATLNDYISKTSNKTRYLGLGCNEEGKITGSVYSIEGSLYSKLVSSSSENMLVARVFVGEGAGGDGTCDSIISGFQLAE